MREYRLLQPHKVNKTLYPAGSVLEMNDELGRWWVEQGIAVRVKQDPIQRPAPKVSAAVPEIGTPRAFVPQPSRFKCCGWK
jgi:hypothetical protein